jgi:hypothetical protein
MRFLKLVAPSLSGGMLNNTIKTYLVLHIHDNVLNFGVPEVMNSSYSESGHISICTKDTTQNTQKRSQTFTLQAAMHYVENLAISRGVAILTVVPNLHWNPYLLSSLLGSCLLF